MHFSWPVCEFLFMFLWESFTYVVYIVFFNAHPQVNIVQTQSVSEPEVETDV